MSIKKILLIALVTIIVAFSLKILSKAIIIYNIEKGCEKYTNSTNLYEKGKVSDGTTYELLKKDGIVVYKSYTAGKTKIIYKDTNNKTIYVFNEEVNNNNITKTAKKIINEQEAEIPVGTYTMIGTDNFWECIKFAFLVRIKEENVNNIDCYRILVSNRWEIYYNKKDFYKNKEIIGNVEREIISYKENTITNEEIKLPDLKEYNIQ